MATFKIKVSRGQRVDALTFASGTAIAGSDAMELNIDATKMSKGDALTMLDEVTQRIVKSTWPPVADGGSSIPSGAITFANLDPFQFSDGTYMELAA